MRQPGCHLDGSTRVWVLFVRVCMPEAGHASTRGAGGCQGVHSHSTPLLPGDGCLRWGRGTTAWEK